MERRVERLFNAMCKDMEVMSQFDGNEEMLKLELSTCGEECFREYEKKYHTNEEENDMEREKVVALVKALGITAEELGIEPKTEVREVVKTDEQFIHEVANMIHGMEMEEDARDNINEKYWEMLGIMPEKKYKVVEVTMKKTIYQKVTVAMPNDEDTSYVEDYIDTYDLDYDNPYDEDDWETDGYDVEKDELTAKEIEDKYSYSEIYNYDSFAD